MSDGVELLDIGRPDRRRGPRRAPRTAVRVLAAVAIAVVLAAVVALGLLRSWDQQHTFTTAEARTATESFDGSEQGNVSPSTAEDLRSGDPQLAPEACSTVLTLGLGGALDGVSWYSTVESSSGVPGQLTVGRYDDPRAARQAHARLHDAIRACDGVDAHPRSKELADETTAVSYTTEIEPSGLRDRLGLSSSWTLRIHQGDEPGILIRLVARPYGNLLLVGLDQIDDDETSVSTSPESLDRVVTRLDQVATDR